MGIWNIHTYTVSPEKSEEHEEAMKQFVQYMQQNLPDIEFNYFRQRFGPLNGRVMVFRSFNSLADWEERFFNKLSTDPAYGKIAQQWAGSLDQSSHDEYFWEERSTKAFF